MQVDVALQIKISPELKREIEAFASRRVNSNADSQAPCTAEDLMKAQRKLSILMMSLVNELEGQR